ncbi:MAG: hypothetical protein MRERV_3c019 [Mycoplasmataceae bacterium RV_VA103A]|nr:MAG: hypothetical protein MRERV_3c019 [Mycoplasmataceae bacterium RV_VA103A]
MGEKNVSNLSNEKLEDNTKELANDIKKNGVSHILFVLKDRFTKEQIEIFKQFKDKILKGDNDSLHPYITIVCTNFPEFEDKEKCAEDKKKLLELEDNKDIKEIISRFNMIHIDNPPLVGRSKKTNKETRDISREKILDHLKRKCDSSIDLSLEDFRSLFEEELRELPREWQWENIQANEVLEG